MTLPDLISAQAKANPKKTAFVFREEIMTYQDLHEKILCCTQALSDLGIKKGQPFGILLRNSPAFVIVAMALSKLGAVCVPINFLEKPDRVALILNDAKAVGILTAKEFYKGVETASKQVSSLKHIFLRDGEHEKGKDFSALLQSKPWSQPDNVKDSDLMMLLYTSGTTGLPKGVMLTHKNFLANVDQCLKAIKLSSKDKFLCLLPMFHSFSWTTCVLIPFKLGCPIVIVESLLPFDPVIKAIWKYKITLFVAVPQIYAALASKISGVKAFMLKFLNPVRICISGAAPLLPSIHKNFEKNLGVPLLEGYGLTECSPVAALNPESKRKVGTVGIPLPGVQIEIRDEDLSKLSVGMPGEIWIKGDNVMEGYYKKPEETELALTPDGWLKTGDIGKFDEEGYLSIVDRKKDLIIVKGLNVYPQEIENVISKVNAVKEVAVVGKTDPETGEELIRAFITIKEGMSIEKAAIFDLCRKELAAYKRPKDIVVLEEMPKNALQKILKKDLRKL